MERPDAVGAERKIGDPEKRGKLNSLAVSMLLLVTRALRIRMDNSTQPTLAVTLEAIVR